MARKLSFKLSIPGGEVISFESHEQVADWIEGELAAWNDLEEVKTIFGNTSVDAVGRQMVRFLNVSKNLTDIRSQPNEESFYNSLEANLELISQGHGVVSTSPIGRKILNLVPTEPEKAMALLIWQFPDVNVAARQIENLGPLLKAMIDVRLDQREGLGDVSAETAALADLREKWEQNFAEIRDSQNDLEREFESWASVTQAAAVDRIRRAKRLARNVVGRFRKVRDEQIDQMAAIRESFRAELSLREPANYWTTKARWHLGGALLGFLGLIGATFLIVAFVILGPEFLLSEEVTSRLKYGSALLIAFPALALFWIMKALSRIFVSNLQLLGDARLRSAMVTTFVSLMENPKNQMTEEDRILILQALFRPAGTEAQDESPPNWFDVLLRRMDKQGS